MKGGLCSCVTCVNSGAANFSNGCPRLDLFFKMDEPLPVPFSRFSCFYPLSFLLVVEIPSLGFAVLSVFCIASIFFVCIFWLSLLLFSPIVYLHWLVT